MYQLYLSAHLEAGINHKEYSKFCQSFFGWSLFRIHNTQKQCLSIACVNLRVYRPIFKFWQYSLVRTSLSSQYNYCKYWLISYKSFIHIDLLRAISSLLYKVLSFSWILHRSLVFIYMRCNQTPFFNLVIGISSPVCCF